MSFQPFFSWPRIFAYNYHSSEYGFCLAINQCRMPAIVESNSHADSFLNFPHWIPKKKKKMYEASGFLTYLCLKSWSDNVFIEEM